MNIKCLIIEDEPLATYILEQYIERTPFLHTARKIEYLHDAVEIICRQKPDIIFLDVNTKGINKYQIQELVRKEDILIIVTTAYPKAFIEEKLQIDLSGLGYLHKPVSYEAFVSELQRFIV
ncbi:Response regulator receiver domain-containing protein [Chitinophaga ginsengisegetis]|jgi:two-component system, LytTR family, response regulator|uniref:Response regulator receiver domain-containing protein n=1 Tax=Chitinophaga ginsengisegetis TaxID=393003 RepID=A0A1T5NFB5_9BACT|nr:response regulator [Chitinophaga ginsengisegetis]SKC99191.1 Response regulator receiver domain-containing protein [Chitinophaga ginsengisegetis]